MSQDQPMAAKRSSPRPPPLVIESAVREYYHDALFKGAFGIPTIDEIDQITAELNQTWVTGAESLPKFTVPKAYYGEVIEVFNGATIQSQPNLGLPEVGTLVIHTKDGKLRRICWYGGQKSPLIFSLHGVRCIGTRNRAEYVDESRVLEKLVRDAYAAGNSH